MKRLFATLFLLLAGVAFSLDNEGWLEKARENATRGFLMDSDETTEDGVYCLVLSLINRSSGESPDTQIGKAVLDAKKKITAFVKGENISASVSLDSQVVTSSSDDEKMRQSYKKLEKKIKTKVNALVYGIKCLGQVSVGEKLYVVCVTCEHFEDQINALEKAQAQFGNEGVVVSVGEASSIDLATQKAIRGAVEQVLGTVVVGYDKMNGQKDFQIKVFSGTDGVVEKYHVLSESDIPIGKRIEIVAKVSKDKLLSNYSNYMKFIGDPAFYIESNSPELASRFTDFFTDMGIKIAPTPEKATYVISCTGVFRPVPHPTNRGENGVQLSLRFVVMEINGKETLIDMTNDPRKSTSFVGSSTERQMENCARKAFKQMKMPLHEKIQAMVGKLVGRKMEEVTLEDED